MLRGRALRITGIPVLVLTLSSACYRYVPVTGTDLVVGTAYRGHLTPEGSQRVAPLVGENVERFDGRIVSVLDTAYLVAISATLKRNNAQQSLWSGEQLLIPRSAVTRFEMRELDRSRTIRAAALYALGIAVVGLAVFSISSLVSGDGTGNPPPPPP
jgi:hypothetical protein